MSTVVALIAGWFAISIPMALVLGRWMTKGRAVVPATSKSSRNIVAA